MRKIINAILCIAIISAFFVPFCFADDSEDSIIYLGRYEQDDLDFTGEEAIAWSVIDTDGNKALLLSNYALDIMPYENSKSSEKTWADSDIRKWLNTDFYDRAFTEQEKQVILTTTVNNNASEGFSEWDRPGSKDTEDKVFLLSVAEYLKYCGKGEKCYFTPYAQSAANMIFKETGTLLLRSPGKKAAEYSIGDNGKIKSIDSNKATGICPAIWIDISIDRSEFPSERFDFADELACNGDYLEAKAIFDELGGYNDSYYLAACCLFDYGTLATDTSDYEEIIRRFEDHKAYAIDKVGYYNDEADIYINDSYYNIALDSQSNGDYQKAIELFTRLGQYRDSMKHLKECFEKTSINWQNIICEHYNAGTKGYEEKKNINSKDLHVSFDLGHFFISGFTSVENDKGTPVYIKTPGDNVTLWFELEDDIDDLNGNGKLSILQDEKGIDGLFKYPKSKADFGRGALLVKHTDSKNKEVINLYTNYLAAKETGGADTKIELKEEGTYEVALDYLVKDSDLKHKLDSTHGYRMYLKFEVKNGSGMVYLKDLETNSELQDYSVTENGFVIDMANSKSLKVNVIRYAINQNWTALDARENRPASDGEKYKKPGYYEITMTNTETSSTLEKHIFVGEDVDLESYIEVEPTLSKFIGLS